MNTSVRVTERSIAARVLGGLQGNLARLGDLQQQLSSGKLLTRPSDSPIGVVSSMQYRSEIRTLEQHSRNSQDGLGWLSTIDTTLTSAMGQVNRARDLVLQGMSAGTGGSPEAREALATEIDHIRQSLTGAANTTYLGRPVFGGTTAGSVAYDATGTYVGDDGTVMRTVGDAAKVRVDVSGQEVFGTGANQLFTVLTDIAAHLRNEPAALDADLARLNAATSSIQTRLSDVGARYGRVAQMRQTADDRILQLRAQLSEVEDIDLPKTITELQLQQTAYQAALAATAKIMHPSLVDFIR